MLVIKNRTFALIFRIFSAAIILFGILLSSGILVGRMQYRLLIYFTFQSNIWCLIFFVFLIIKTIKDIKNKGKAGLSNVSPLIRGEVMLSIILTHLIYHYLLAPRKFKMNPNFRSSTVYHTQDILVHYITPLLTVLDYIFFCEKNTFHALHPFFWLSLPFAYLVVVFIVAHFIPVIPTKKSRYPYFFIDVDLIGIQNVIKYLVGMGIGLIAFAYLLVFFDWFVGVNFKSKDKVN